MSVDNNADDVSILSLVDLKPDEHICLSNHVSLVERLRSVLTTYARLNFLKPLDASSLEESRTVLEYDEGRCSTGSFSERSLY